MKNLNLEPETQLSSSRKNLFAVVALFVIVFSIYANTFDASWHLDDDQNIQNNKAVHLTKLNWKNIKKTFFYVGREGNEKLYRPTACFSFAVNYYFGRLNVFGYHLVNIFIHFFTSVFLFLFIHHTLNLPILRERYGPNAYPIALLATVFWAINPVQTQAVTYIVQRMASMAGMFYIMSMYFYLKGRTAQKRPWRGLHYFMCLSCMLLSVGAKENAVMLPFSIFVFDLFLVQGLTRDNIRKNTFIFFIMISVVLVLALILRGPSVFDLDSLLSGYKKIRPFTMGERLLTEPRVVLYYISLLFYPMPNRLCISHDFSISRSLIDPPTTLVAIIVILIILGISIKKAGRRPLISYCILFFFLNHIIESSIFPLEFCFEHRNYIPAMLFFIPIALLLIKGIQSFTHKPGMYFILTSFVVLLLIGLGHSTFVRNFVWESEISLWQDAVLKSPDLVRPHTNLGVAYYRKKMHEAAMAEYRVAISKQPKHQKKGKGAAYLNIALIYDRVKQMPDEALIYYRKALELRRKDADAYNNMGAILSHKGMVQEALAAYRKAIKYKPDHRFAHMNLGKLLIGEARIEEAIPSLEKAMSITPNDATIAAWLGYAYRVTGSPGKALLLFKKCLELDGRNPNVLLYLSEICFQRKEDDEADQYIYKYVRFAREANISSYIEGVPEKNLELNHIWPYKKMVLKRLSEIYSEEAAVFGEKAEYLNNRISEMQ